MDSILESDAETVGLRPDAIRSLDVARFEACTDDLPNNAEEAVALYAGDLAEGLAHDCFAAERERLADRYEDALALVARRRLEDGDDDGARAAAERLIARDPGPRGGASRGPHRRPRDDRHALAGRAPVPAVVRGARSRARRGAAARDRRDLPDGAGADDRAVARASGGDRAARRHEPRRRADGRLYRARTSTSSRTASADRWNAARSASVSSISNTRSMPRPSTTGTPTNKPSTPNSPVRYTAHGRTRLRSSRIARPSRRRRRPARRTPSPS